MTDLLSWQVELGTKQAAGQLLVAHRCSVANLCRHTSVPGAGFRGATEEDPQRIRLPLQYRPGGVPRPHPGRAGEEHTIHRRLHPRSGDVLCCRHFRSRSCLL